MTATTFAGLSIIVTAATFVWWQARLLRFSLQVQSLLAIENRRGPGRETPTRDTR
jgi:hypothetical protein